MHAWRIYITILSVIVILSAAGRLFLFFKRRDLVSPLDLVEACVGLAVLPALRGFALQQARGPHQLWIILCFCLFALSLYQFFTPKMKTLYQKSWRVAAGIIAAQTLIGGPALWALIRYVFFEPALWP